MEKPNETETELGYCEYCYKVFPLESLISMEVWINGKSTEKLFCSKEHGHYSQMGAEG